jgi:hypothetical protein
MFSPEKAVSSLWASLPPLTYEQYEKLCAAVKQSYDYGYDDGWGECLDYSVRQASYVHFHSNDPGWDVVVKAVGKKLAVFFDGTAPTKSCVQSAWHKSFSTFSTFSCPENLLEKIVSVVDEAVAEAWAAKEACTCEKDGAAGVYVFPSWCEACTQYRHRIDRLTARV